MKRKGLLLIALITIASLAFIYAQNSSWEANVEADEFYFGTSFGGQTTQEAKELIDKVKNYTDFCYRL
jgi:hypothetical protein